jgi:hypothetical protein
VSIPDQPRSASATKNAMTAAPIPAGTTVRSRRSSGENAIVPNTVTIATIGTADAYESSGRCPAARSPTASMGTERPIQPATRCHCRGTERRRTRNAIATSPAPVRYNAAAVPMGTYIRRCAT